MTYRLVSLMSLVLLLSLASFAFLMQHLHQDVMEEVTRTISDVGQATLRTFEFRPGAATENAIFAEDADFGQLRLSLPAQDSPESGESRKLLEPDDRLWVHERLHRLHDESASGEGVGMGYVVVTRSGDGPRIMAGSWKSADDCPIAEEGCEGDEGAPDDLHERIVQHLQATVQGEVGDAEAAPSHTVVIQIEEVRAVSDPARGTFLRIPTVHAVETDLAREPAPQAAPPSGPAVRAAAVGGGDGGSPRREIILPIRTGQFQAIFDSFRSKTLFLFVGVFLVGTVLSASLAARFTRPVRRLDAGIRRLTEGDLDVQVEASGNDEVGRLGRAFNEMTRRLRSHRDREREVTRREKLSSLGRLAAGVAHDVRNPLHSIGLTLSHLQETARPTEEERAGEFDRALAIIREEVQRLDRLVGNFLRFARSDRRAREKVDLPQLLRETAQLVEKEAERRGIRVEVADEGVCPAVDADVESIRSSILNLVLNSFEATSDGGTVTLRLRPGEGEVVLEVEDTGRGIPEADQERVFDFAYTTREDGHGLGLAMVHQVVVEDHGGRISLESRPGEGTRVRLAFPSAVPGTAA